MPNEPSRKVCQEIHHRIKGKGHGALKTAEKKLKLCRGYLTAMKTAGDTRLSTFFDFCSVLGEPPEEMIRQALYEKTVDLKPYGRPPKICSLVSEARGPGLPDELLTALDQLRFRSPERALRNLYAQAHLFRHDQAPQILILAAHCFRALCRFNESLWCLTRGFELAGERSVARGYLHLGIFNLLVIFGFLPSGMLSVKKALNCFVVAHDLNGIGTCLANQAYYALMNQNIEEAIERYHNALNYGESMSMMALVSSHQCLASCHLQLDHRKLAVSHLRIAIQLAEECDNPEALGKTLWISAGLKTGPHRIARLQEAIATLPDHCAMDVALATFELAAADPQNASLHARKVFRVLDHLSYLPMAQKALDSLLREVFMNRPNQMVYDHTRKVLTEEWARFSRALGTRLATRSE